jgi:hypothetical protein
LIIFYTRLVPLDLNDGKSSFWKNKAPSSTRFCRPIRIQYAKETTELIQKERDDVENEIKALNKSIINLVYNDLPVQVRINFNLFLTMIDGKVANAISGNKSTRTCNICKATPTQMNRKQILDSLSCDPSTLEYGLSALHAYIRCFECILHISYRLFIKKWMIRAEDRERFEIEKRRIQREFWGRLGLLVDFPRDNGSDTSNDSNTARRAFQNHEIFAEITQVDKDLIWRLYNILCLINFATIYCV